MPHPRTSCSILFLTATVASAFSPPSSNVHISIRSSRYTSYDHNCPSYRRWLLPDFVHSYCDFPASSFSSSSLSIGSATDLVEVVLSNVGGFLLLTSLGLGLYSEALQDMEQRGVKSDSTNSSLVSNIEEQTIVVDVSEATEGESTLALEHPSSSIEEGNDIVVNNIQKQILPAEIVLDATDTIEVKESDSIKDGVFDSHEMEIEDLVPTFSSTSTPPSIDVGASERVLKETEKAIAQVKAWGVSETKEKMSSKRDLVAQQESPVASNLTTEQVAEKEDLKLSNNEATEVSRELVLVENNTVKDVRTKTKATQGMILIAVAVGMAIARNVVKLWLGKGML